ncbi:hypothetical protein BY996DRAFT_7359138 [Phakopsora pachyrhizi]|nr:hypothetical protein BY996DRAFT_7359138 [Phakopsora pachyrhizi]
MYAIMVANILVQLQFLLSQSLFYFLSNAHKCTPSWWQTFLCSLSFCFHNPICFLSNAHKCMPSWWQTFLCSLSFCCHNPIFF